MELIDKKGKTFTINDIKGSIAMVQEFLHYKPSGQTGSLQRLDEERQLYWEDFLKKLEQLQNDQNK